MTSDRMNAVKKYSKNGATCFVLEETPRPGPPGPNEVQIRIQYIGVCTSDIHALHGALDMPDGNIVGHEFSGTIATVGKSVPPRLAPGDRVICELAVGACFNCKMCRSGHYEFCPSKRPPGWASQGVYTEYVNMPAYCVHTIPPSVSLEVAALAEPTAVCVYGCLERGRIQKNDFTVIYGMGPIGLLCLIILRDSGVENIVCVTPTRRGTQRYELAKGFGPTRVLAAEEDVPTILHGMMEGGKADVVIDCSGAPQAIAQGVELLRKDGTFVALGVASAAQIPFPYNAALAKALRLTFSWTSSHDAWLRTVGILDRRHDEVRKLITHRFPLKDWKAAVDSIEKHEAIKAVLFNPE